MTVEEGKAVPMMGVGFTCCSKELAFILQEKVMEEGLALKRLKQTVLSQICSLLQGRHGVGLEAGEILKLGGHPDADMRQSWHKLE